MSAHFRGGGEGLENSNVVITQQFSAGWERMSEVMVMCLVMCLAWLQDEELTDYINLLI